MNETVTSAEIVDGAIVNADVSSSAAIAFSKMADLTASRLLVSDGNGDVSVSDVTSAEALLLDGGTSATSTTLAAADRLIVNDNGTIVQVALSDFETFFEGAIDTLSSAMTFSSTVTVGSDGSGQDVIFYSGTSGDNLTWDSSEECLTITGTDGAQALKVADGDLVVVDKIYLNDNDGGEYISGDGTDLTITSGRHIVLALGSAGSVYHTGDGGTSNTIYGKDAGIALDSGGNYNVFLGENAGEGITVADDNVAIGYNAFYRATTQADKNVAIGSNAMSGNFTTADVDSCVVVGYDALSGALTTDADGTIAIGHQAGKSITEAQNSTIVGYQAGDAITDGDYNTLFGHSAGTNLTSGGNNIAIGSAALRDHQDGHRNIAIGGAAMYLTQGTTADGSSENIAIGYQAMGGDWDDATSEWNIAIGNYAMDSVMHDANYNTSVGHYSLSSVTQSDGIVAVGYKALESLTVGGQNTAIGAYAGEDMTDGDYNTLIGYEAGANIISGHSNICIGREAGKSLDNSDHNIAIGRDAMNDSTHDDSKFNIGIGSYTLDAIGSNLAEKNIAIGYQAGSAITDGDGNTFMGYNSGQASTSADSSVGIGTSSCGGSATMTGNRNIGIGAASGSDYTSGQRNICIGGGAGSTTTSLSTGDYNIIIGDSSRTSASGGDNQIVLGYSISGGGDSTFRVGNASGTATLDIDGSDTSWAAASDVRLKENVVDSTAGLSFIKDLRPITYNWKKKKDVPSDLSLYKEGSDEFCKGFGKTNYGFIAQEVKESIDKHNLADGHNIWSEDPEGIQELSPGSLMTIMVKAVQELSAKVEELESKLK